MTRPVEARLYAYELLEWINERSGANTSKTLNPIQTLLDLQKKLKEDATGKE